MPASLTTTPERYSELLPDLESEHAITEEELPSLRQGLEIVADYQRKRGVRYPFVELLLCMVCAMFSGNHSLTSITEWAQHTASLKPIFTAGKAPSLSTFHRLAVKLDPVSLDAAIHAWIRAHRPADKPLVIAVDGKEAPRRQ